MLVVNGGLRAVGCRVWGSDGDRPWGRSFRFAFVAGGRATSVGQRSPQVGTGFVDR